MYHISLWPAFFAVITHNMLHMLYYMFMHSVYAFIRNDLFQVKEKIMTPKCGTLLQPLLDVMENLM